METDARTSERVLDSQPHLQHDAIGVPGILFFVVAAAAPLTVVVGVAPLLFGVVGNLGAAGAFTIVGVLLFLFSVGYAAMSRFISGPGGFALYVARAFGSAFGGATGYVAVLSYPGFMMAVYGFFGFLSEPFFDERIGIDLPWWVWSFLALAAVAALGYRAVNLSARVLGVILVAEVLIVLLMDAGILLSGGDSGLSLTGFEPSEVFAASPGLVLLFVVSSFAGFEATAIYGEEARDRHRTIPRATYVAVIFVTVFYVLTFWAIGIGYGDENVVQAGQESPGTFVFDLMDRYVGGFAADVMTWLVLASVFAVILAFHNSAARYLFGLGRNGMLPSKLGSAHRRHHSPHVGSLVTSVIAAVVVAIFALAGGDPFLNMYAWFIGFATVGLILLYASCSISVIGYLRLQGQDPRLWHSLVAPGLSAAGLLAILYLSIANFEALTGSTNSLINTLWLVPGLVAIAGWFVARSRYRNKPRDAFETGLAADRDVGVKEQARLPVAAASPPRQSE